MNDKIVGLVPKEKVKENEYIEEMLKEIDLFRQMIVDGKVSQFVISSMDFQGYYTMNSFCREFVTAIGLFELGKNTLMMQAEDID